MTGPHGIASRPGRHQSPGYIRQIHVELVILLIVIVSGTQHDTFRAFLSGIFFGIAGGSIITFLQELVVPFSRRRDALNAP